jgi:hypothetical protein
VTIPPGNPPTRVGNGKRHGIKPDLLDRAMVGTGCLLIVVAPLAGLYACSGR